jgi:hypothetical protein
MLSLLSLVNCCHCDLSLAIHGLVMSPVVSYGHRLAPSGTDESARTPLKGAGVTGLRGMSPAAARTDGPRLAAITHCRIVVRVIAPVRCPGTSPGVCPSDTCGTRHLTLAAELRVLVEDGD